ncbi:hypothetical protein N5P37_010536 [Trichoderma harzianum]|nr:hypothetical protein N5P37_010536 [Trichoderma harzianum]
MFISSTGAVHGNSNTCNELQDPSDDCTQPAALAGVPDNPTENIDRFLNNFNNRNSSTPNIAAEYQRPPIELREAQGETEAETQARVRMLAQLQALDKIFALSGDQNS